MALELKLCGRKHVTEMITLCFAVQCYIDDVSFQWDRLMSGICHMHVKMSQNVVEAR
jgi:hypothetical protein